MKVKIDVCFGGDHAHAHLRHFLLAEGSSQSEGFEMVEEKFWRDFVWREVLNNYK